MSDQSHSEPRRPQPRRFWRYALAAVLLLWALSWGFLAYIAPGLVHDAAVRWAQGIGRQLTLEEVAIHPWRMSLELKGVRLRDRDGSPLFAAERIQLDAMPRALLIGHWHAEMLALSRPEVDLVRAADGSWNWARLVRDASGPGPSSGSAPKVFIDWLTFSQGRLVLRDLQGSPDQTYDLQRINLNLHDLSTLAGEGGYTLSATLGEHTRLKWRGLLGLEPLSSSGRITISQLPVADVWDYLAPYLHLAPPRGNLSLDLNYVFDLKSARPRLTLSTLFARIDGLGLRSPDGQSQLALGQLALEDGLLDLQKHSLFFKRIHLSNGQVTAVRNQAGQLDWLAAMPAQAAAADKPAAGPAWHIQVNDLRLDNWQWQLRDQSRVSPVELKGHLPFLSLGVRLGDPAGLALSRITANLKDLSLAQPGQPPMLTMAHLGLGEASMSGRQIHGGVLTLQQPVLQIERAADGSLNLDALRAGSGGRPVVAAVQKAEDRGWQFTLPRLAMADGRLVWRDRTLAQPAEVTLAPLAGSLSPHPSDGAFDVSLNAHAGRGQLDFAGQFDPAAAQLQGQLTAQALPLTPLSPYLLAKTPLAMPQGNLSAKLDLRYGATGWQLAGSAGLNSLLIREAGEQNPLLAWRALNLSGLKLSGSPLAVSVRDVQLDRPVVRLVLDQNRVSNLRRLFAATSPTPAKPATGKAAPLIFDVRMIRVRNGNVDFADQGMKPAFATRVNQLGGTISGLSSRPGKRGAIALNGLVDQNGDVRVRGALAPLSFTDSADIQLMFRNIPLTSLNTYSENIAGWQIDDGRLSVELQYLLSQRKLKGDNRIVVDSIKLGPQVERPGISRLPLSLAVLLLQDSHGRIDLHLPVSGDLDDPQFSYGGLVWQAFVNVVQKVATAPFRALGAMLGMDGFDDVRFVAGEAAVTSPERQKLGELAKMMSQRPQMRLSIAGTWDPQADRRQLARARVDRAILQAAGVVLLPDEPLPAVDVQDVEIQQAIKTMFADRVGRLKLVARMVSGGSGPAFYTALRQEAIQNEAVADADLLALANARARGAQQYLAQTWPELKARISLAAAKTAQASADGVPLAIDLTRP
ncbi:DUF748 domain-containing protein [Paludibacterium sp. THUN1379]|uniref:DUF748 domain-containing protein n=1 Tax=Paludibacterium sp. THUN1379 TaxID=3112107 RepID=UPI00308EBF80|nr:DUF748 domain-containing protein [Paludibacterium sp. THUN1379]